MAEPRENPEVTAAEDAVLTSIGQIAGVGNAIQTAIGGLEERLATVEGNVSKIESLEAQIISLKAELDVLKAIATLPGADTEALLRPPGLPPEITTGIG